MCPALTTAIFLQGTLSRIGTLLLGAIVGVLLNQLLSPSLDKWRERRSVERARRHRRTFDYAGRPLEFDGVDVGLQVLFGTLGRATKPEDVRTTLDERQWVSPAYLRSAAERYAERFGFYDGLVARLNKLDLEVYTDARGGEHHRLLLEVMPTGYYDFLATNVGLGPFTPATAPLLRGRGGLAETQLSNMIALDTATYCPARICHHLGDATAGDVAPRSRSRCLRSAIPAARLTTTIRSHAARPSWCETAES